MRVTLSMIVKNESKYLRGCLDSVFGAVDEIVIVDTGSNDDTIAIAEEYGAKVFHFPWQNDFSMARNFALEKSTGDWILYLDADERLTPGSIQELRKITSADERCGYEVTLRSVDDLGGRP
ncbi:partial heptose III glucuronosyltransferase, partial [Methylococcales bacterium]